VCSSNQAAKGQDLRSLHALVDQKHPIGSTIPSNVQAFHCPLISPGEVENRKEHLVEFEKLRKGNHLFLSGRRVSSSLVVDIENHW
jgi:hypothetical protein